MAKEQKILNINQMQQIRREPDMYGGTKTNPDHMVQEAFDNAIDQVLLGNADRIIVGFHKDGSASIMDNGGGIPFSMTKTATGETMPTARMAWTIPNSSSHYQQVATTSIGKNGIGMKYTTATSSWFTGEAWRDGNYYKDHYETTPLTDDEDELYQSPIIYTTPVKSIKQDFDGTIPFGFTSGTRVSFLPNEDIYDSTVFNRSDIKERLHQQAFLNKGLTITLIDEFDNTAISFFEPDGLKGYIKFLSEHELQTEIIEFEQKVETSENNYISAKIALAYNQSSENKLVSFVNSVRTPDDGTHVNGFYTGWARLMNDYASKFNLAKDTIESRDLKAGITAVVLAFHTKPQYAGQTKDKLANADATQALIKITKEAGAFTMDHYPKDIEFIIKKALEAQAFRKQLDSFDTKQLNSKEAKKVVAKKVAGAATTGLVDRQGNKLLTEIFAVEGDSAGGGIQRKRINNPKRRIYQAVLPLRGKVISSFNNSAEKVFANAEIAAIVTTLGCGVGKDYNESKLNYDKFIITTDADVDGDDIALLLLTFFFKHMPQFVKDGHLYLAVTPLYVNHIDKKNVHFTYTETEQKEWLSKNKPIKVNRNKGLGELEDKMVYTTICNPETRKLIRLQPDDFDASLGLLELFKGPDAAPRREYIENHYDRVDMAKLV